MTKNNRAIIIITEYNNFYNSYLELFMDDRWRKSIIGNAYAKEFPNGSMVYRGRLYLSSIPVEAMKKDSKDRVFIDLELGVKQENSVGYSEDYPYYFATNYRHIFKSFNQED